MIVYYFKNVTDKHLNIFDKIQIKRGYGSTHVSYCQRLDHSVPNSEGYLLSFSYGKGNHYGMGKPYT